MRTLFTLTLLAALALAGSASAQIGWAGNAYPLHNTDITPTGDQFVVAQVYKGGVTDAPGQGADISAELFYTTDIAPQASVAMAYNTDIGNNDEYIGYVPQSALVGASWVDVTVVFTDLTDMSTFEITGDQSSNPPPLRYNVVDVTPIDVTVTFTVCLEGVDNSGPVCVIGGAPEIGDWGSGVFMNNVSGDIWTVDVVFAAGSNPTFEYKYRKDVCQTWEGNGNRTVVLPTDGVTNTLVLDPDGWDYGPLGCGLGDVLSEDKEVCLQVCLEGVGTSGLVCAIGNRPELGDWVDGTTMYMIGPDLYHVCFTYPQGTPFPINAEYKFRKDGCDTWEGVPNRSFTVDDASPTSQTILSSWDDGPGMCQPVPNEDHSWGALKSMYR